MPIIQSAKKKMRKDKRRTALNKLRHDAIKASVKNMRRNPTLKALGEVSSALDKAAKTKYIHPNKAARLKSRLAHLIATPSK